MPTVILPLLFALSPVEVPPPSIDFGTITTAKAAKLHGQRVSAQFRVGCPPFDLKS